jgi:hypothetical protein
MKVLKIVALNPFDAPLAILLWLHSPTSEFQNPGANQA